jgi:uncharacterized protein (DUF1697 family)
MDHLRSLFEALGFSSVETFIASGNVIFDSSSKSTKALEKKIETYLQKTLGYAVATFIRSTSELAAIAGYKPFSDSELNAEGHTLYIGFMADSPTNAVRKNLPSLVTKVDDVHLDGREVYWLCRTRFGDSLISGALLAKTLGMPLTLRNVTTIKKLAAKYS